MKINIFLALIASTILGCGRGNLPDLAVFKEFETGLRNSNKVISNCNSQIVREMEYYSTNPLTAGVIKTWPLKTKQIDSCSSVALNAIENLITRLKKEASFRKEDGTEKYYEDDIGSVKVFFSDEKNRGKIEKVIDDFKIAVLKIDVGMTTQFNTQIDSSFKFVTHANTKDASLEYLYFNKMPLIGALGILERLKSLILSTEYDCLRFCRNMISVH